MTSGAAGTVKRLGREAGFDLVRITSAKPLTVEHQRYVEWVEQGRQGTMRWITPERVADSADPLRVLPGARSVICAGMAYWDGRRPKDSARRGKIARYAWGTDYHAEIGRRLQHFAQLLRTVFQGDYRWHVDTGPLMDKALAARSGLGWYGKNTNILTERFGSFVLLGEIVTTLELAADVPLERDCGACRLCVVACPTGALGPDYSIDSRKCISYLTIEHRGPIPRELRAAIGDWVFGCDICQDVCPPSMQPYLHSQGERRSWAADVRRQMSKETKILTHDTCGGSEDVQVLPATDHPLFRNGRLTSVDLTWLLRLRHQEYVDAFRGTAIKRAKDWMLRRNAAVALGNVGDEDSLPYLCEALTRDDHPIVRGHVAWAIGQLGARFGSHFAAEALRTALDLEQDLEIRLEIEAALKHLEQSTKKLNPKRDTQRAPEGPAPAHTGAAVSMITDTAVNEDNP